MIYENCKNCMCDLGGEMGCKPYKMGLCGGSKHYHPKSQLFNKAVEAEDNVNKPAHYTSGKIETIDYIQDNLTIKEMIGFCKGNIIKYISRERLKNGLEDVKKAHYYINKLVTLMEDKDNEN